MIDLLLIEKCFAYRELQDKKYKESESKMRTMLSNQIVKNDEAESSMLKKQLEREINCLERQLERIRVKEEFAEVETLSTYEDMIESRRKMLSNLPWED